MFAGVKGGFDITRLLDSLQQLDGTRIAVDRRSIVTVEAYLVMLDQMYRAVYYHHAVRAASALLSSTVRRAFQLFRNGDAAVFPPIAQGEAHPLQDLAQQGQKISLRQYARLGEFHVWTLIEAWQGHTDKVLSDLAGRLMRRRLFKTIDVDPAHHRDLTTIIEHAKILTKRLLSYVDDEAVQFYVFLDEPDRTSYKRYDWRSESPDESIFLAMDGGKGTPIEENPHSKIVAALKETKYFHRLIIPEEIKASLQTDMKVPLNKMSVGGR
jgi:hypothetical protein